MTDETRKERSEESDTGTERPKLTTAALAGAGTYFAAYRERQREVYEADPPHETDIPNASDNADVGDRDALARVGNASVPPVSAAAPASQNPPPSAQASRAPVAGSAYQTGAQAATAATMARAKPAAATEPAAETGPLFPVAEAADFRARWDDIQVRFIDEPRRCVEQADTLVAETMQRLAQSFAKERQGLEDQWDRGGDISTEDLRLALRRYRSFFGRLMQV